MPNMKSSKDVAKQATNNLDPNIGKIASTTDAIASTLSQQSSAIQQLKESLSKNEAVNEEANKKIASSLQMSHKQISVINKNIGMMTKQVSSMTNVVSNMSMNSTATVSLLGGIQTSLVQITSVLTAFRADYLLANSGNKVDGTGYYDVNLLRNVANGLKGIKNSELQKQIQSIVKAANYANKASNAVRGRLGNSTMAKDDDEFGMLDKILGKGQQLQGITGLLGAFLPENSKLGKAAGKFNKMDFSSLGGLLASNDKTKGLLKPLQELGMDLEGKNDPMSQWLSGMMGKAGLKKSKKEREKDPNLVMSSLAPFADDIKDMVETSYQGLKSRPKAIPIYATPVWIVNSKDQTDYVGKVSKKDTHGSDLEENRLKELLEGIANNTKDKYGRELLVDNGDGTFSGQAKKGFGQERVKKMKQEADNKIYQMNHDSIHDGSELSKQIRGLGQNGLGILENFDPTQGAQGLISGGINALATGNTGTGAFKTAGNIVKSIFGSHKGGKKGKKGNSKDLNNEENLDNVRKTTEEHEIATIDQDTTILNESQTKKSKTAKDILNGQLSVAAGLNALIDISTQENIYLSDAVNNGTVDPKNAKGYSSSFGSLEQLANEAGADNATKKAIKQFKKSADLSKVIGAPKKKNMTDDEYWGRDKEDDEKKKEEEKPEDKLNKFIGEKINGLKKKILGNDKVQAGIATAKKMGKKILEKSKIGKLAKKAFGLKKNSKKLTDKLKDKAKDKLKSVGKKIADSKMGKKAIELKNKAVGGIKNAAKSVGSKISKKLKGTKLGGVLDDTKKMFAEELEQRKKAGKEEEDNAKKLAEQELKNAKEQGDAEKAATEKMSKEDEKAQKERLSAQKANDEVIAGTEKAEAAKEAAQEEAANAKEIALKQTNAATEGAIQEASAAAAAQGETGGLISNIAAKLCGLPTPAKIALGVAGVAAVGVLGAAMIKKIKDAMKGKKSSGGGDSKGGSKAGGSKDQEKEAKKEQKKQEKERKKQEKAEKKAKRKAKAKRAARSMLNRLTGGLTAAKVYIDDEGNVLKSKGDEPIKMLDEDGNETDETLNVKSKEGKKQFAKRLAKREFKLDKAKALKKALKKIGGAIKGGLKKVGGALKGGLKKVGGFFKKHKAAMGGIAGLAAHGAGKLIGGGIKAAVAGVKGIIGKLRSKKDKKEARLNQLLLMSSSAYLFMDEKLQKQLDGIENTDFGKKITENPEKASNLLFNSAAGGISSLLSKAKSAVGKAKEKVSNSLSSLLDKITKKLTGEDDTDKKYSSDLKDLSESGTIAGIQANQNEWRRRMLDTFTNSMGLGSSKTGDNGKKMTTSQILDEQRKAKAIKLGVYGTGYGTTNSSTSNNTVGGGSSIASAVATVVKAYETAGIVGKNGDYNQSGKTVSLNLNGKTYKARPDCTGLCDAVIECLGYNSENMNSAAFKSCSGIKDKSGNISSDWKIIENPSINDIQLGDICITNSNGSHHGEIASGVDGGTVYGWNYGSENGMKKALDAVNLQLNGTEPFEATKKADSKINGHKHYDRVIRYIGGVVGGMSNVSVVGKTAQEYFTETLKADISRGVLPGHNGIDFSADMGTAIYSPLGGKVVSSAHDPDRIICTNNNGGNKENGSMGNFVILQMEDGNYATFMHMKDAPMVKTGDMVVPGQQIGLVGNTGGSYGAHLHFEIRSEQRSGKVIDPAAYALTGKGRNRKDKDGNEILDDGKYGKAVPSSDHIYQRNYSNYLFNTVGDTELQTLGDSGCGPAAAAAVKRHYKNVGMGRGRRFGGDKEEQTSTTSTNGSSATATSVGTDLDSLIGKTASETMPDGTKAEVQIVERTIVLFKKFREMGFSDASICGALANFINECGGDFSLYTYKGYGTGLMMWTPANIHYDWCATHGYSDPDDWEANVAHAIDEVTNGGDYNRQKKGFSNIEESKWTSKTLNYSDIKPVDDSNGFKTLTDPELAAMAFERIFECSGDFYCSTSEAGFDDTYNRWKSNNMMYDYRRRVCGRLFYSILNGGYLGSASPSSSAAVSGGPGGYYLNLIADVAVDGSALSNYSNGDSIWDKYTSDFSNKNDSSSSTSGNSSTGSGRYGRGRKYGRGSFGRAKETEQQSNTASASNNQTSSMTSQQAILMAAADVWKAMQKVNPSGSYDASCATKYDLTCSDGTVIKSVRPDCTGMMTAVIQRLGYIPWDDEPAINIHSTSPRSWYVQHANDFIRLPDKETTTTDWQVLEYSDETVQCGDIVLENGHAEMFMWWDNGQVGSHGRGFSAGSTNGINDGFYLADEVIASNGDPNATYTYGKRMSMPKSNRPHTIVRFIGNGVNITASGSSGSSAVASGNATASFTGFINFIPDTDVGDSVMSEYNKNNKVWSDYYAGNIGSENTGKGKYGKGKSTGKSHDHSIHMSNTVKKYANDINNGVINSGKGKYGRATDGISFANTHFVAASNSSPSSSAPLTSSSSPISSPNTNASITSNISNTMSVTDTDEKGNSKTTTSVYTDNNKTTLTTSGKSTIVICNNFAEKTKTDLTDILNSFKHLNGTQNNALKVLKAISDLIKEENPEILAEAARLRLNNDGLDFILKGF